MTFCSLRPAFVALFAIITLGCASKTPAPDSGITIESTTTLEAVSVAASRLGGHYGHQNVLIVFDLDNTLLAGVNELGSDQWYDWQSRLSKAAPCDPAVVSDRLALQGALFHLGSMRRTEDGIPERIERLHANGHPVMLLTARGSEFRLPTFREMRRNGISFADTMPQPSQSGLQSLAGAKRPILYEQGAMLVAGQHKGNMLLGLFDHFGWPYPKAVVFADDKQKNIDAVAQALRKADIPGSLFRYDGELPRVEAFDEEAATATLEALYPSLLTLESLLGTANFDVPDTMRPASCPN